jgi:hypothetical protein
MPTDLVTRDDRREENRKTLMVIFAIIGFLVTVSVVIILVKN